MIRTVLYAVYGVAVLGLLGTAQYRGWSFTRGDASVVDPKSVRANPGAYRSPYFIPGRTLRGK
jgi:hypothetical protein